MNDVERFIDRFRSKENAESIFSGECSYWFASILYQRFIRNGAKIMYHSGEARFAVMIQGNLYDITGSIDNSNGWIPWLNITNKSAKKQIINKYILY